MSSVKLTHSQIPMKYLPFLLLALLGPTAPVPAAPQLNSKTVPTVGAMGNSICRLQYTPREWGGLVGANRQWTPFGAFVFFACDGIAIPELYAFEGHSGKTAAEIAGLLLPKDATEPWGVGQKIPIGLAALAPNITIIIASTNELLLAPPADAASGKALDRALDGLRENIRYVQSLGSIPVVCNLPPIEGQTPLVPGASIPDDLTTQVPAWNEAIKVLCQDEDVWYCDIFSACAKSDGSSRWQDGFVYRQGSEVEGGSANAWKVHPSQLATLAIAREALRPVLSKIIGPECPALPSGDVAGNLAPPPESWKIDYDPQADGSLEMSSSENGGTILNFKKPSHTEGRYAQWTAPDLEVIPGQTFLYTADLRLAASDNRVSLTFSIADRSPESASRGQPLLSAGLDEGFTPGSVDTGKFRASGIFTVPENVSRISPNVSINRSAGGTEGKEDIVQLESLLIEQLPPQQAAKHQPAH